MVACRRASLDDHVPADGAAVSSIASSSILGPEQAPKSAAGAGNAANLEVIKDGHGASKPRKIESLEAEEEEEEEEKEKEKEREKEKEKEKEEDGGPDCGKLQEDENQELQQTCLSTETSTSCISSCSKSSTTASISSNSVVGDSPEESRKAPDNNGTDQAFLVYYLYLSYLLCRWGDRMWEFAVGLFMIHIWEHSLLLASLYGLVEMATIVIFGVTIGNWMDKFPRLKVMQASLALQNLSIFGASIAVLVLLVEPWPAVNKSFKLFSGLVLIVNVFGGVSALASLATKVSLERDWVVVMADENPAHNLTTMNATIRRIDLSCTLLAAVFVGLLMSMVSVITAAIFMAAWNVTCVGIEYWLLSTIYRRTPRLHERRPLYILKPTKPEMIPSIIPEIQDDPCKQDVENPAHAPCHEARCESNICSCAAALSRKIINLPVFQGWRVYMKQQDMLAGISFSLLSLTVLSFGTLMTASLTWRGCPAYILGLARGISALIGICGTVSYPFLQARLQTLKAGLVSIILQWTFATLCVISVWLKNPIASTALLISGAAAARAGLYMFDLSVTQLMQESVPEEERGVVVGVQNSMQSFCFLLSFVAGMIIPRPQDFDKLIFISFGSMTLAVFLYAIRVYANPVKKEIPQSRQWQ